MADHLMLAEGYRLVPRPPTAAPAHGPQALRKLQPHMGPCLDSGLRPRGAPLGPPGAVAYGAFGPQPAFQPFAAVPPPAASSAHLHPVGTLYPGRATVPLGAAVGPPNLQPAPGAPAPAPPPPPPAPAHALGSMDAELIDEEALTSLEVELGLHRVRELPELYLGQSEFDYFSDLGSTPPAGSVSC
ncbi:cbp/p300-interacting transactivator 4 [Rhynchonycteris naso]